MGFLSLFQFSTLKKQLMGSRLRNERGQGLIEYLVIVAFVGIASISIMRVIGQNVKARFGNISAALGAKTTGTSLDSAEASAFKKNDFTNFMDGAKPRGGGGSRSSPSTPDADLPSGSGE